LTLAALKMTTLFGENLYAGLSGLELEEDSFELGGGVRLIKTYAYLMAPFTMAFKPAAPGHSHPGPWKAASGGFGFDVSAELLIPASAEEQFDSKISVARTILFLLRLGVNPATTLPVFSNYPFDSLAEIEDNKARFQPFEVQPRHFPLGVVGRATTSEAAKWVADRWQVAHRLINENTEFALAVEAIDSGQFVQNSALTLVSLWGALESLFSPSTSELRFRVSSLIAAFLEPPGAERHRLQREVAKLYDKRSAAAHGKPKHEAGDLLATFSLLRRILMKIIDRGAVPSKDSLDALLFGVTAAEDGSPAP
jgi:hypothetical protein